MKVWSVLGGFENKKYKSLTKKKSAAVPNKWSNKMQIKCNNII